MWRASRVARDTTSIYLSIYVCIPTYLYRSIGDTYLPRSLVVAGLDVESGIYERHAQRRITLCLAERVDTDGIRLILHAACPNAACP